MLQVSRKIHKIRVPQLEANTTYYYRVYDSDNNFQNWQDADRGLNKFKTGPEEGSHDPFSFCVYGDSRITSCVERDYESGISYGTEAAIKAVMNFTEQQSPDFVIHLGDFEYTGRNRHIIRRFFSHLITLYSPNLS